MEAILPLIAFMIIAYVMVYVVVGLLYLIIILAVLYVIYKLYKYFMQSSYDLPNGQLLLFNKALESRDFYTAQEIVLQMHEGSGQIKAMKYIVKMILKNNEDNYLQIESFISKIPENVRYKVMGKDELDNRKKIWANEHLEVAIRRGDLDLAINYSKILGRNLSYDDLRILLSKLPSNSKDAKRIAELLDNY